MMEAIFKAIASVFDWLGHRSKVRNTSEMIENEKARSEQKRIDETRKAIREKDTDEIRKKLSSIAIAFLAFAVGFSLLACSTVAPKPVEAVEIAWDGGEQTAGLLGWTSEGWAIVTPSAVERYQALLLKYAERINPPVDPTNGFRLLDFEPPRRDLHLMDPEVLELFVRMSGWERDGE
jgi:hypothetical protein